MFTRLKLTNFRQHADISVDFQNGTVVILGSNEKGKSSLFEAIGYAMFGSTALRDPFAQVVTYGQKEATLKVELDFVLNGNQFSIRRSKSGAELDQGGELVVTGQDAVTKFVEGLLGASAKLCMDMMFATQNKLRGALQDGPSAAVKLIEVLANFELIDEIIGLAQEKLPTGNTTAVEERIRSLSETTEPAPDTTALSVTAMAAQDEVGAAQDNLATLRSAAEALAPAAQAAKTQLTVHDSQRLQLHNANQELSRAQQALAELSSAETTLAPSQDRIEELELVAQQYAQREVTAKAHKAVHALTSGHVEWEGTLESLQAEIATTQAAIAGHQAALQAYREEAIKLTGQLVKEETCGLCGKDLKDVPEVAQKNSALTPRIAEAKAKAQTAQEELDSLKEGLNDLQQVLTLHGQRQRVLDTNASYVKLDTNFVPFHWTWIGGEIADMRDPGPELRAAKEAVRAAQVAAGRLEQAQTTLAQVTSRVAALKVATEHLDKADEPLHAAVAAHTEAQGKVEEAQQALQAAQQARDAAAADLRTAQALAEAWARQDAARKAQLKRAEKDLTDTNFNNALLKKLRSARPLIANELWSMVLASVSHYFTAIRGIPSTVTRDADGFKVNGQLVGGGGLSGSALDALGLSIRVALTRTFLPNARFFILDEPAAAADEQRELNMLGLISTVEFDQILLVTHSDLANSFASQVIQL